MHLCTFTLDSYILDSYKNLWWFCLVCKCYLFSLAFKDNFLEKKNVTKNIATKF